MLRTRVLAALVFAPALLGLVYLGGVALEITCAVLALLMAWEFLRLTLGAGNGYGKAIGYVFTAALVAAVLGHAPEGTAAVAVPLLTMVLLLTMVARPEPIDASFRTAAFIALGVLYCGGLIPYLAQLRAADQGLGLAMMALFCTWGADTGAYFSGRFLGKHKLYPKVSPKKTIEGAVGGLAAAVGIAFLIRWLFEMSLDDLDTAALGAIAGTMGMVGDLCESLLKRSVGAKDSSALIPGHGGVLDRFDAVIFVAPAMFIYLTLVGL